MKESNTHQDDALVDQTLEGVIIESIFDIKGEQVTRLDLRELDEAPCDFFILCSANSSTQIHAIASNIQKNVKDVFGELPDHVEGYSQAQWILLDYFDFVVHIFHPEFRAFYDLESLWSAAIKTEYDSL